MAPSPVIWASTNKYIDFVMSKYLIMVSDLNSSISDSKQCCCSSFHLNRTWFFVSSRRGAAFLAKFSMKSVLDCIMHKKLTNSSLLVGGETYFKTSTLEGSGCIPSSLYCNPKIRLLFYQSNIFRHSMSDQPERLHPLPSRLLYRVSPVYLQPLSSHCVLSKYHQYTKYRA